MVAIMMHAEASTSGRRTQFQRERHRWRRSRPATVSIHDFGAAQRQPVPGHGYLQGHNLRAGSRQRGHAGPAHPRSELALRGLGAAHRAGIVHRDLKPENVFIAETDDGEVAKLLDFGIARKGSGSSLTHSGALMGTPAYMAPEQVAGNRGEVGTWSDVYAMGVILYEMLTGRAPFAADSMTEVLSRVLSREFAPLRSVRAGLPEAVPAVRSHAGRQATHSHADALREAWRLRQLQPSWQRHRAALSRLGLGGHDLAARRPTAPPPPARRHRTPPPGDRRPRARRRTRPAPRRSRRPR
jgi:serine/threonine-protein kinase